MELFRIAEERFSRKLLASGQAGRWNAENEQVLYTSSSRALSTLEKIVHLNSVKPLAIYKVMVISIADDDNLITQILSKNLPKNWRLSKYYSALQELGTQWYSTQKSLILKVPSAIILKEFNYLINLDHTDFKKNVKLVRVEEYFWDERILN